MSFSLVWFRSFVFVLFMICSCIICSVGVWKLSLDDSAGLNSQITAYLVFLGAFGITCGLPVMFIDILRKNAFTSRISVECVGVGILWVMHLSGAAAISANFINAQCTGSVPASAVNACTSAQVLIGFSWIATFTLLLYSVTLTVCTIIHQTADSRIWHSTVRDYPWFSNHWSQRLHSASSSPMAEKGMSFTVVAPKPMHPVPSIMSEKWALGASLPQKPPETHDFNNVKYSYAPAASEPTSAESGNHQRPVLPKITTLPSLYPAQVHSAVPPSTQSYMKLQSTKVEPTPPGLGKLPQKSQPGQRLKRKPVSPTESIASSVQSQDSTSSSSSRASSVKPKGPRAGSHPKTVITHPPPSPPRRKTHRPPPLNLNNITSVQR